MPLTILVSAGAFVALLAFALLRRPRLHESASPPEGTAQGVPAPREPVAPEPSEAPGPVRTRMALLNALEDLTAAHARLAAAQAYGEALMASAADGVIAVDAAGRISAVNDEALRLLGARRDGIIGRFVDDAVPLTDEHGRPATRGQRPLWRALTAIRPDIITDSGWCYLRDGVRFPASVRAAPVLRNGNPAGAIEVFRDLSAPSG